MTDWYTLLSWLATITTIATNFSHIPTCMKIKARGSTVDFSCFPLLCMLSSAIVWMKYGLMKHNVALIIVNMTAVILNALFLAFFYFHTLQKHHLHRKLALAFLLIVGLLTYIKYFTVNEDSAAAKLGIVGTLFTMVSYGSPLSLVAVVVKTKSTESMPFMLTCANLLVSIEWTAYGYVLGDIFIQVPNLIGFFFTVIQLLLFCIYPSTSQRTLLQHSTTAIL